LYRCCQGICRVAPSRGGALVALGRPPPLAAEPKHQVKKNEKGDARLRTRMDGDGSRERHTGRHTHHWDSLDTLGERHDSTRRTLTSKGRQGLCEAAGWAGVKSGYDGIPYGFKYGVIKRALA
jgi:hypothetical protein